MPIGFREWIGLGVFTRGFGIVRFDFGSVIFDWGNLTLVLGRRTFCVGSLNELREFRDGIFREDADGLAIERARDETLRAVDRTLLAFERKLFEMFLLNDDFF